MAVLVLQPLAVERGASRGRSHEKTFGLHVTRRPDQVTDALEAEHGIKDKEGHHLDTVVGVGRAGSDPR